MPYLPADMPAMCVAMRDWVVGQIGPGGALAAYAAAPYSVVWADQDAPYPGHPYATLSIQREPNIIGNGQGSREWPDDGSGGIVDRTEYDSEFVFRVQLLSRAPQDPASGLSEVDRLIHALPLSAYSGPQTEAFDTAGLAVVIDAPPVKVPKVAGFGIERRAYVDVTFRARTRVDVRGVYVLDSTSIASLQTSVHPGDTIEGSIGS